MAPPRPEDLGPLAPLVGTWEGTKGLDVAFHNDDDSIGDTPYRERVTFNPFGPVDNGDQCLFGLDYRMAAWRGDEEDPFHTEVGYWLWDAAHGQVMRCFMVPRGSTLIAGGDAAADSKSFTMVAEVGSPTYGILSNIWLDENAKTIAYEVEITIGDGEWSYDETTTVEHKKWPEPIEHTDKNTLTRVD